MTRRGLITTGCAAVFASLLAAPAEAEARAAPRVACPHARCRHNRPDDEGGLRCGLSLERAPVFDGALP